MSREGARLGLGLGLLSALGYGANIPYAKLSAMAGVSGPDIVLYRAVAMVALTAAIAGGFGLSLRLAPVTRGSVIGLGIATSFVALCYISSVAFIPVGVATIIFYTFPLVILVASPLVDGERLTVRRLAIFVAAFAGLFLAIGPGFASLDPRGLALAAAAVGGATAQFFFAARATRAVSPLSAAFWTQLIQVPVALAICTMAGGPVGPATLASAAFPVLMTCGLFVAAFGLHLVSARLAAPAALGLVFCAEPVTSVALASLVLGEALTAGQAVGGALVLGAVLAAIAAESRRPALA
jgi:drug/metabolite transporter (DMT)-like permease